MIKMYTGIHVKYPVFLSDFNESCIFSTDFWKILEISNFTTIRPVGAQFFHVDRHDEANSRFPQFCERA